MGISSLTSFIECNPQLLETLKLHDTCVIIDGNNLLHYLYKVFGLDHFYGGNYEKFHQKLTRHFTVYKRCGITPYVVFDGGYDYSDRKLRTTLKRNKERMNSARLQAQGIDLMKQLLPVLAGEVLRDVLIQLSVPFAQCDFEADDQIVALANHLQCPVLSLDSDFYIFDVSGGFVPLNQIQMHIKQERDESGKFLYKYLECKVYRVDHLLSHFENLDRAALPLFATVLGNDYVDVRTFENFFSQIKLPKHKSRKLQYAKRHCKMIGLLSWLQNKTVEEATGQVVSFLKKQNREKATQLIKQSVDGYIKCKSTVAKALGMVAVEDAESYCLKTMHDVPLPDSFTNAFFNTTLPPFVLNAVGQQRVMLQAQIECPDCSSSYSISLPIRQQIYTFLAKYMMCHRNDSECVVTEYDRVKGSIRKNYVPVSPSNDVPSLEDIQNLDEDRRKSFVEKCLGCRDEDVARFPPEWQLFMMVVIFWIQNADPCITEHHVNAVVLCLLNLSVFKIKCEDENVRKQMSKLTINKLESQDAKGPVTEITTLLENITADEAKLASTNLEKFDEKYKFTRGHKLAIKALHGFAQLQTCVLYTNYFNRLLFFPFVHLKVSNFLSGNFVYNACVDFRCRKNPSVYIAQLLGHNSKCFELYTACTAAVLKVVDKSKVQKIVPRGSLNSSIKRKKSKEPKESVDGEVKDNLDEDDLNQSPERSSKKSKGPSKKVFTSVSVSNRFMDFVDSNDSDSPVEFCTVLSSDSD